MLIHKSLKIWKLTLQNLTKFVHLNVKFIQICSNFLFIYTMKFIYMTNPILFVSSIGMTVFHYIGLHKYNPKNDLLIYCILFGLITSILNHGLSHSIFKYLDRFMMFFAFFINIYFTTKIYLKKKNKYHIENIYLLIILAVILFFVTKFILKSGKILINYVPHLLAHILITMANILLIREYDSN